MAKILVVDDEKSIRALCAEELSEEGYEVVTTGEGKEVMGLIAREKPSVVILDIRMEDCDGLDLLQDLRNAYPGLPIILNTAYDSYRDDVKSVAADYYVVKSFDLSELKTKIAALIKEQTKE
jgi:DNA-binding response OmpR family regulator